jgi:hypothetical protein
MLSLAPDLNSETFANYGVIYGTEGDWYEARDFPKGRYNSGEDVQSFAGATWYPFLSEVRPKRVALVNYTGYYVANALVQAMVLPLDESPEGLEQMRRVSLLSISDLHRKS